MGWVGAIYQLTVIAKGSREGIEGWGIGKCCQQKRTSCTVNLSLWLHTDQTSPSSLFLPCTWYSWQKKVFFNHIDIPLSDQIRNAWGGPKHKKWTVESQKSSKDIADENITRNKVRLFLLHIASIAACNESDVQWKQQSAGAPLSFNIISGIKTGNVECTSVIATVFALQWARQHLLLYFECPSCQNGNKRLSFYGKKIMAWMESISMSSSPGICKDRSFLWPDSGMSCSEWAWKWHQMRANKDPMHY